MMDGWMMDGGGMTDCWWAEGTEGQMGWEVGGGGSPGCVRAQTQTQPFACQQPYQKPGHPSTGIECLLLPKQTGPNFDLGLWR